ncbi:hypothetical protein Tco_1214981 [Tanacetum coccineum]
MLRATGSRGVKLLVPNFKSGVTSAKRSLTPEMPWHQNSVGVKQEPVGLTEFAFTVQQQDLSHPFLAKADQEVHSEKNSSYKISSVDKDKEPQQKDLKAILALSTYFVFSTHKR